jgi:hypothetical protein
LTGPLDPKPVESEEPIGEGHTPMYSMGISAIPYYDTKIKIDYVVTIWYNPLRGGWIKTIEEVSRNYTRVLEEINYTGIPEKLGLFKPQNKGHTNLSLDLEKVSSSKQYLVVFLVANSVGKKGYDGFTHSCGLLDFSDNPVYIPPLTFNISASENPLQLNKGEEKTLELRITSPTLVNPRVNLTVVNASQGTSIEVLPASQEIVVPPAHAGIATLKVKALETADSKPYTIAINSTISVAKIDKPLYTACFYI